jgi:ABC-type phosphate transport system substrate-binding protein
MLLQPAAPRATAGCVIVVNDANPFYSASTSQVADLFLAKRVTWTNGNAVTPVDQMPEAQVREEFSVAVLGRPLQAVQAYWRAKVYREDVTPPQELGSDQAVIDFVKTHPNAIGYVTPDAELPAGVHAVVVMR